MFCNSLHWDEEKVEYVNEFSRQREYVLSSQVDNMALITG